MCRIIGILENARAILVDVYGREKTDETTYERINMSTAL